MNLKIAMDLDFAYRLVKLNTKGYYIPEMVVKMDGKGISSTKYLETYLEVSKVVFKNKDFSVRSVWFLVIKLLTLAAKVGILKLRGEKLLGWYRKRRYKLR